MQAIFWVFLRLMIPMALIGGVVYLFLGAGRRFLERLAEPKQEYLRQAHIIAQRIARNLETADPTLAGSCMAQIHPLLEERLPHIIQDYEKLSRHLRKTPEAKLRQEVETLEGRVTKAKDEKLRSILTGSLELARRRLEERGRMAMLSERTEAQLRQVLLYLEAVESRSLSLGLASPQEDVASDVSKLLDEVSTIEQMYRDMDFVRAPRAAQSWQEENAPPGADLEDRPESRRDSKDRGKAKV